MGTPDIRHSDTPVGPYRDVFTQDIRTEDYEDSSGFTFAAVAAGTLMVRTAGGVADVTTGALVAGGTFVGPGGIPVLCVAVRANSTVRSVIVGIL